MYSPQDDTALPVPGFPIRTSPDQSLLSSSPKLIAANHVLHRLLAPRHPPCALSSLISIIGEQPRMHEMHLLGYPKNLSLFCCQRTSASETCFRSNAGAILTRRLVRRWRVSIAPARRRRAAGGADRDRTDDLRLAKPALSQLSYSPVRGGPR